MEFVDETLVCKDCGKEFIFTAGEQEFYAEKGFQAPVEVPDEIWEVNERLIRDGFDTYALR